MTNWKNHAIIGAILSAIVFYFLLNLHEPLILGQLILISAISALIPDVDTEISKGRKLLDAAVIVLAGIIAITSQSWILFFAIVGLYFIIYKLFKPKHRGITHTLVACLVFSVLVYVTAGLMFAISSFIGYFSHLTLDKIR